ncbi:MAG: hypothetical protein M0Q43_12315 [Methanothrix sp.]|jgi:hypothetical protein|nr:hypothetical protein [Methanothrix sp.]
MILKILRLTLHSDAPMRGDAAKIRGFFATSFNEHALLHQHVTDKLIYKYPLIQYKMLDGNPMVLGINEGADVLKEIYDKFDEIKLGESKYSIMERGITLKSEQFGCSEEIHSYSFATPWRALSQDNYPKYLNANREERKDLQWRSAAENAESAWKFARRLRSPDGPSGKMSRGRQDMMPESASGTLRIWKRRRDMECAGCVFLSARMEGDKKSLEILSKTVHYGLSPAVYAIVKLKTHFP